MQITTGFIGEALEKFSGQTKAETAGIILILFAFEYFEAEFIHAVPDKIRAAAEIHNGTSQSFVHRQMCFTPKRVARIKACAVATDAALFSQRLPIRLTQSNAHIFHSVMQINIQIAFALHLQIADSVFGE